MLAHVQGTCLGGLYFDLETVEAFLDTVEPLDQFFPLQSRLRGTKLAPNAEVTDDARTPPCCLLSNSVT